jgi:hypothetical protein
MIPVNTPKPIKIEDILMAEIIQGKLITLEAEITTPDIKISD